MKQGTDLVMVSTIMVVSFFLISPAVEGGGGNAFGLEYPYSIGDLVFPMDEGAHSFASPVGGIEEWNLEGEVWDEANRRYLVRMAFTINDFMWFDETGSYGDMPESVTVSVTDAETGFTRFRYGAPAIRGHEAWFDLLWLAWDDGCLHGTAEPFVYETTMDAVAEEIGFDLKLISRSYPFPMGWTGRVAFDQSASGWAYALPELVASGELWLSGDSHSVTGTFSLQHHWFPLDLDALLKWAFTYREYDWFTLSMEDGTEFILWGVFPAGGGGYIPAVNIRHPDGGITYYKEEMCGAGEKPEIVATGSLNSSWTGRVYRHGWQIRLPRDGIVADCHPVVTDQELTGSMGLLDISYWWGAIDVHAVCSGSEVNGTGFARIHARLEDSLTASPPPSLTAIAGDRIVSLEWAPSLDPVVSMYKVYWGNDSRRYHEVAMVDGVTKFQIRNLGNGETLFFTVTAMDTFSGESAYAIERCVTPAGPGLPVVRVSASGRCFRGGDTVSLLADINNPGPGHEVDLYTILAIDGELYFGPDWGSDPTAPLIYLNQATTIEHAILNLQLPVDFSTPVRVTAYTILTYPGTFEVLGYPGYVTINLAAN
ncbi:hypothetical protein JW905_18945 [bacterium]|nr:hypothetical protein [candidate division CSSED10-310 bacterium]